MNRIPFALIAASLVPSAPVGARADQVDTYVETEMQRRHIPGLSLAVVKDGKIIRAKGYGLANVERNVPATPETVYELGTASRQFSVAAVLSLVEEGEIGLNDPISRHLAAAPNTWTGVTVRHLLTSTSGLEDPYLRLPEMAQGQGLTADGFVRKLAGLRLRSPPGRERLDNNTGFVLLGAIVEKVAHKTFGEFLEERFFKPLAMTSTRLNKSGEVHPNGASGYHYSWRNGLLQPGEPFYPPLPCLAAAAGLVTSAADLAKWEVGLDTGKVIKQSTLERIWEPGKLRIENIAHSSGYSLSTDAAGRKCITTTNLRMAWPRNGYSAGSTRWVSERLTVVVLCNIGRPELYLDAGALARGVARAHEPALGKGPETRPADDPEPRVTGMLKGVLVDAVAGKFDPQFLTPQTIRYYSRSPGEWDDMRSCLSSLGPLESFTFIERERATSSWDYRFRAVFGTTPLIFSYSLTEAGKVSYTDWWDE